MALHHCTPDRLFLSCELQAGWVGADWKGVHLVRGDTGGIDRLFGDGARLTA